MAGFVLIMPPVLVGILGIAPLIIPGSASVTVLVTSSIAVLRAFSINTSLLRNRYAPPPTTPSDTSPDRSAIAFTSFCIRLLY